MQKDVKPNNSERYHLSDTTPEAQCQTPDTFKVLILPLTFWLSEHWASLCVCGYGGLGYDILLCLLAQKGEGGWVFPNAKLVSHLVGPSIANTTDDLCYINTYLLIGTNAILTSCQIRHPQIGIIKFCYTVYITVGQEIDFTGHGDILYRICCGPFVKLFTVYQFSWQRWNCNLTQKRNISECSTWLIHSPILFCLSITSSIIRPSLT